MNHKWLMGTLTGLVLVSPLVQLRAQEEMPKNNDTKEARSDGGDHHNGLGLTDDQKSKFKSIKESEMKALKPLMRKQRDLTLKLKDQIEDNANDSDLKATLAALKSNHEAIKTQRIQFKNEKEALLTPLQQAKMVVWKMKGHNSWRHHERGGEFGREHEPRDESERS